MCDLILCVCVQSGAEGSSESVPDPSPELVSLPKVDMRLKVDKCGRTKHMGIEVDDESRYVAKVDERRPMKSAQCCKC
jgi:hypothetical protein